MLIGLGRYVYTEQVLLVKASISLLLSDAVGVGCWPGSA